VSGTRLVDTTEALAALARDLGGAGRLALDTEADSLHAFREKVCVVQVAAPGHEAIVDALAAGDLSPLRDLVAAGAVEVVFHGGDYDMGLLRRDHGFSFPRVFDTMVAATLLGEEQVGLAALLEKSGGVRLDKRFQKADWRRRPFSPEQVEYLRNDVAHLLALRESLGDRLREADLVEEAEIEFRRLAARSLPAPQDDPEGWRRVKGVERLSPIARTVFVRLFRWRDRLAGERDVPRFKVFPNEGLLGVAREGPLDRGALERLREVPLPVLRRHEADLLGAVHEGIAAFDAGDVAPPPQAPREPRGGGEGRGAREREERLRRWRTEEAVRRRVPNVVVLPNAALESIVRDPPPDVAALAALEDVGPKRAARYGEAILRLLRP
jgi:ribonuclease D